MLPLPRQSPAAQLEPIIVCFQPLPPSANLPTDWNGMTLPPSPHRHHHHHHTPLPLPHTRTHTHMHRHTPCRLAIRSLNGLCFLSRHKADSKANSHCLKWHRCPGICLTFCLMHKAESMHNPCLINIFPLSLSPLVRSSLHLTFIPEQPHRQKKRRIVLFLHLHD